MKKAWSIALAAILMIGTLTAIAAAQEKPASPQLKTEMVRLKYVTPEEVRNLLRPYQTPYGQITWSSENDKLLVVGDMPENLARMLEIIREIDIKPADILFTVQLVLGSESGDGRTDEALKDDKVISELMKLLRYRTFTLLDQNLVRTLDQKGAEILIGKGPEFVIAFHKVKYVKDGTDELIQADVRLVRLEREPARTSGQATPPPSSSTALVQTSLTMKSGEKTVVGVSRMDGGDKGLILIISGKVIG
jgi:hypothetical protein